MALFGDDRLLESMQEFRIFGRVDHIHDFQNDNFFREHKIEHRNRKNTRQGYLQHMQNI